MPWLNGLEMIEKVKENKDWASIPICIVTTETAFDAIDKAKSFGINAFMVKPIKKNQLLTILEDFVEEA